MKSSRKSSVGGSISISRIAVRRDYVTRRNSEACGLGRTPRLNVRCPSFFLPCRRFCLQFHVVFPEALKRPSYWFKPTPAVSAENALSSPPMSDFGQKQTWEVPEQVTTIGQLEFPTHLADVG